ncbi:MAG: hypothetical protein GY699_25725 [Desulfobacteraceae bacterium]|nr:hypothetical protein [Desulfobacteraceae bacterium]
MKYFLITLFAGLAIFVLSWGIISAIQKEDWTGALGFTLLCIGTVLIANGIRSKFKDQ